MGTLPSLEHRWEVMLGLHTFSIGPFVVTSYGDDVRVYHMRTEGVCHCLPSESFREIQRLCHERGYDFRELLERFQPKTFLWKYGAGNTQGKSTSQRSSPSLQPIPRDTLHSVYREKL